MTSLSPRRPSPPKLAIALAVCVAVGVATLATYRATRPAEGHAERFVFTRRTQGDTTPRLWKAPDFSFQSHRGEPFTLASLSGRPAIVDFVFTQCSSECPMLTARLAMVERELAGVSARFVSFSVDPEHDTPAVLAAYANAWNPGEDRWTLLATTRAELPRTLAGFQVHAQPSTDPDNPIVHSSAFLLLDGEGWVRGVYASADAGERARLVADTKALAANHPSPPSAVRDERLLVSLGCLGCHENPRVAPTLGGLMGRDVQLASGMRLVADEGYVRRSILTPGADLVQGYSPLMPSYEPQLRPRELDALVREIAALPAPAARASASAAPIAIAVDPICGMKVRATPDAPHVAHEGKEVYFCAEACRDAFVARQPR